MGKARHNAPRFSIGDSVKWQDPASDYASDYDYMMACEQERKVTDILSADEDVIYELDYGTEVYESELTPF